MNEYDLDIGNNCKIGTASIKQQDNTQIEIEFNIMKTALLNRKFSGETGTHEWKITKPVEKENTFKLKEGDYVVVVGIYKDRIQIVDPNHDMTTKSLKKIKTYQLNIDSFIVDDLLLTPESL